MAGSIAKQIGKHNVLYLNLITNIISCILPFFDNEYSLIFSRVFVGLTCGFGATVGPRLLIESVPTNYRGIPPTLFTVILSFGTFFAYSLGKIFGREG